MSKETAQALKALGQEQREALAPKMAAQADVLREADQANAAAREALAAAQGNADLAATNAAGAKAAMDALEGKGAALDRAIMFADNAADTYEALVHLRNSEAPEDVIASQEARAGVLEAAAKAIIQPEAPTSPAAPVAVG